MIKKWTVFIIPIDAAPVKRQHVIIVISVIIVIADDNLVGQVGVKLSPAADNLISSGPAPAPQRQAAASNKQQQTYGHHHHAGHQAINRKVVLAVFPGCRQQLI